MDLTAFADDVGPDGPVTCVGGSTQWAVGGEVDPSARVVRAPEGIEWIVPEEMTLCCGAGTPVTVLLDALAERGQTVALPRWEGATVGGILAVGRSGVDRLGRGPVRDTLLQARVVTAGGLVAKAGGPTVKNVSGYDLCRLLVGSLGTLAFLGEVILRTRPLPEAIRWLAGPADPFELRRRLHAPTSVLWDGTTTWILLEGDHADVDAEAARSGLAEVAGPPELPTVARWSVRPGGLRELSGRFVAEVGVGIVHHTQPPAQQEVDVEVVRLNRAVKERFDPSGRLNPGRCPLGGAT